jgi:hypothetical protein
MIAEFLSQWNPFNVYGAEVKLDDLMRTPLQPNETLMRDKRGCCRRIKTPALRATLWEKVLFWLQIHLNEKGYLDAIDHLITTFENRLFEDPPQQAEKLEAFNEQLTQLRSLKNDYGFVHFTPGGDPVHIERRLQTIQRQACSIFEYWHQQQVLEQEAKRKEAFILFCEGAEKTLHSLAEMYVEGLQHIRFLMVSPPENRLFLLEERLKSLWIRLEWVQQLNQQIDEMEKIHRGKFTIPYIKEYLKALRMRLYSEVQKIGFEAEMMIENVRANYRETPFKEQVEAILRSIQVSPDEVLQEERFTFSPEGLEEEILRVQKLFHFHR